MHTKVQCRICREMFEKAEVSRHQAACERSWRKCEFCAEKLPEARLRSHEDECGSISKACKFCKISLPAKILIAHEESCGQRMHECHRCLAYLPLKIFVEHEKKCENEIRKCDICSLPVKQVNLAAHREVCGQRIEVCGYCDANVSIKDFPAHVRLCEQSFHSGLKDPGAPNTDANEIQNQEDYPEEPRREPTNTRPASQNRLESTFQKTEPAARETQIERNHFVRKPDLYADLVTFKSNMVEKKPDENVKKGEEDLYWDLLHRPAKAEVKKKPFWKPIDREAPFVPKSTLILSQDEEERTGYIIASALFNYIAENKRILAERGEKITLSTPVSALFPLENAQFRQEYYSTQRNSIPRADQPESGTQIGSSSEKNSISTPQLSILNPSSPGLPASDRGAPEPTALVTVSSTPIGTSRIYHREPLPEAKQDMNRGPGERPDSDPGSSGFTNFYRCGFCKQILWKGEQDEHVKACAERFRSLSKLPNDNPANNEPARGSMADFGQLGESVKNNRGNSFESPQVLPAAERMAKDPFSSDESFDDKSGNRTGREPKLSRELGRPNPTSDHPQDPLFEEFNQIFNQKEQGNPFDEDTDSDHQVDHS